MQQQKKGDDQQDDRQQPKAVETGSPWATIPAGAVTISAPADGEDDERNDKKGQHGIYSAKCLLIQRAIMGMVPVFMSLRAMRGDRRPPDKAGQVAPGPFLPLDRGGRVPMPWLNSVLDLTGHEGASENVGFLKKGDTRKLLLFSSARCFSISSRTVPELDFMRFRPISS